MQIRTIAGQAPLRMTAGTFILNSGFNKLEADDDMAKQLHGLATRSYPIFEDLDPQTFVKVLRTGEILLGGALLTPLVSNRLAGAALGAFAVGLLGLYLNAPGMRRQNSIRPTHEGMGLAKDVWLLGMSASLVFGPRGVKRARGKR